MCLFENLHQKADDPGGFDLDAFPYSEELDFQDSEDVSSNVVDALHCLGGERGALFSHASLSLRLELGGAFRWQDLACHACS